MILRGPGKISQVRIFDRKFIRHIVQDRLQHWLLSSGQIIFFYFLWSKGQNFFPTLGGQIIYFIYKNCQTPQSIGCPQIKPGNKRTKLWNGWCQIMDKISRIFGIFFLVDFLFSSDNSKCFHRNGFEMYILIIIYTICTCDTLVPTRILNSEISWFCFDFPKWGPVSFIITDFNVFVQFFE